MLSQISVLLHVAPLFLIVALICTSIYYKTFTVTRFNPIPHTLMLSSVGIASGFLPHGTNFASCYACVAYGLVVAACAFKLYLLTSSQEQTTNARTA
jgi:hypothetical protein